MKFISLFGKTPQHRKFSYTPRFYDAQEEERREREERIKNELSLQEEKEESREDVDTGYRSRIAGSFKNARRSTSRQSNTSASLMRFIILTFLALLLVAFFQFGNVALYGLLLFIPFYFFLKLRNNGRRDS